MSSLLPNLHNENWQLARQAREVLYADAAPMGLFPVGRDWLCVVIDEYSRRVFGRLSVGRRKVSQTDVLALLKENVTPYLRENVMRFGTLRTTSIDWFLGVSGFTYLLDAGYSVDEPLGSRGTKLLAGIFDDIGCKVFDYGRANCSTIEEFQKKLDGWLSQYNLTATTSVEGSEFAAA